MKKSAKLSSNTRFYLDVWVIFFFALLITLPLYFFGIPGGADMPQHFQFASIFYDSLSHGSFFPSWADKINFGYGDVGIRFYPPLTYYVLSFFRLISGSWYDGACLAIVFFFFVGGIGTYLWAREWFSETSALVGALFYLIIPYHLNQIYQATLIAEFAAASIIPFCFLYATRVCRKGNNLTFTVWLYRLDY
ncbi:MAG: hypothetical protein HC846_13845 [Blastocatellia bacterium]|nr:hypothetical protein [Blastocatellia bacterium]